MELGQMKAIVEGLLFASGDEGVTVKQLSDVLQISKPEVINIIELLRTEYEREERGLLLMISQNIIHMTTKPEHSHYLKKMLETPTSSRMSQAALETLAIIAYRQPITRIEIEEIRGVKSDGPVQTLLNRSMIEEVGRKDTVGRPVLFGTTKEFLTYFGLTSIDELPPLSENDIEDTSSQEIDLFFEKFNEDNIDMN